MLNRLVVLIVGAGLGAAVACQPAPGPLAQADVDAIQAVSDSFTAHMLAKDWEALSGLYAEDAVLMPPNEKTVTGQAAIRDWMAAFPPISQFSLRNATIEGRGDLAYVRGTYALTLGIEGSPADSGKYIEIRKQGPDGMWRLTVDIFNSSRPPMPPAPPARRR